MRHNITDLRILEFYSLLYKKGGQSPLTKKSAAIRV